MPAKPLLMTPYPSGNCRAPHAEIELASVEKEIEPEHCGLAAFSAPSTPRRFYRRITQNGTIEVNSTSNPYCRRTYTASGAQTWDALSCVPSNARLLEVVGTCVGDCAGWSSDCSLYNQTREGERPVNVPLVDSSDDTVLSPTVKEWASSNPLVVGSMTDTLDLEDTREDAIARASAPYERNRNFRMVANTAGGGYTPAGFYSVETLPVSAFNRSFTLRDAKYTLRLGHAQPSATYRIVVSFEKMEVNEYGYHAHPGYPGYTAPEVIEDIYTVVGTCAEREIIVGDADPANTSFDASSGVLIPRIPGFQLEISDVTIELL